MTSTNCAKLEITPSPFRPGKDTMRCRTLMSPPRTRPAMSIIWNNRSCPRGNGPSKALFGGEWRDLPQAFEPSSHAIAPTSMRPNLSWAASRTFCRSTLSGFGSQPGTCEAGQDRESATELPWPAMCKATRALRTRVSGPLRREASAVSTQECKAPKLG